APWLFHRLDEHWEWVGRHEVPEVRKKPSEYFRSSCFLAVEADETPVKQYVEWFGDENLVFSTDYPHADSKYPHSVEAFMKLPLWEAPQRKVRGDSWAGLYGVGGRWGVERPCTAGGQRAARTRGAAGRAPQGWPSQCNAVGPSEQ